MTDKPFHLLTAKAIRETDEESIDIIEGKGATETGDEVMEVKVGDFMTLTKTHCPTACITPMLKISFT